MERTFFSYHACLFYTKNQCSSFLHETSPWNQSRLSFRDASFFDAICLQSISSALMLCLIPIRWWRERERENAIIKRQKKINALFHMYFAGEKLRYLLNISTRKYGRKNLLSVLKVFDKYTIPKEQARSFANMLNKTFL